MDVVAPTRPRFDKNAKVRDIDRAIYDQALIEFVTLNVSSPQIAGAVDIGKDKADVVAAFLKMLLRENCVEPRPTD